MRSDVHRLAVHPRWRGEQSAEKPANPVDNGSSPLARGTASGALPDDDTVRFIPAGAGNRRPCFASAPMVHGSSPLARGTDAGAQLLDVEHRFIPAGAGNRTVRLVISPGITVHPRWRGEQASVARPTASDGGSSPLARGTADTIIRAHEAGRFIPAGAGNSQPMLEMQRCLPVHPRWRGEQFNALSHQFVRNGSSTLARGTDSLILIFC